MKHDFTVVEGIDMMLCKEGTTFWALAQMKKGFKVWQPKTKNIFNYDESCYYPIRQKDKSGTMINRHTENNFIKEFSDTFEIYREAKFKVGDWIRDKRGNYYQVSSYISNSGVYTLRKAGQDYVYAHEEYGSIEDFELTTLEPDFSNAKMCDDVFSTHYGYAKVHAISPLPKGQYRMWLHVPSRKSSGHYLEEVLSDNKSTMTTGEYYPTLFHDHHQAKAYFDELFMKLDEEQR